MTEPAGGSRLANRLDRLATLAFYLFVAALPWSIAAISISAALWGACAVAASIARRRWRWLRSPVDLPALAWFAALVLASIFALHPATSFTRLGKGLMPVLVGLVAWQGTPRRRGMFALGLLLASAGIAAAVGLARWLIEGGSAFSRAAGPAGHYMTFGGQLLLWLSATAGIAFATRAARWRWAAIGVGLGVGLPALAATFTRSAWLGLVAALGLIAAFARPRALVLLAAALGLVVALAPAGFRARLWSAFDPHHPTNIERTYMWEAGARIFRDHPLTGVGLEDLHRVYDRYRSPRSQEPAGHLHSIYFQIAATMGITGLVAFALLFSGLLRSAFTGLRGALGAGSLGAGLRLGVGAGLIGFLVAGCFEWNFGDEELLYLLYTLVGLAWAARGWQEPAAAAIRAPLDRGRAADLPRGKVALVHDWLTGMRGGEKVLERIARSYPGVPIYTLVWKRGAVSPELESHPIRTSYLQRLPGATRRYRWFLPLFPDAIERFDLSGYEVVISTSHAVAKSVRTGASTFHLSYVHTPMRYVWELEDSYFPPGRFPWPLSWYVRRTCARLREWDRATSGRPHALLANSAHVADRIRRHYGRDAVVVHPPVAVEGFEPAGGRREYDLLAGAFAPYKRADLAIEACRQLGRRLVIAGSGQQERELRRLAGPGIEFRGQVDDRELARLLAGARALLYPGEEDFGIVPVEAMASGCPVIAFGRGGALETVGRGATREALERVAAGGEAVVPGGVLFGTQSAGGLARALQLFETVRFTPAELRARAEPFAAARFDREFQAAFESAYARWRAGTLAGEPSPDPGRSAIVPDA